ncbi:hypothetical protein MPTK1_4g16150 [Marchantia polymorpha subsp. ruderalis]|uniref:Uncharacterized protein n=2 Tax=Marchantia polymorpha TaxID=3197 RepID=A0AAF6BAF1_MARPO|nr:hypothetical protein MARPO_0054s0080 [Marchantia polymorpha]BBN08985.1 hypothetical protein Mp_4g16150 [Marchantia polymorpha subsp. ruderalis]|eukprot:PTQ37972.1 hypothetical protein MARPO_0054s0080 [Marchantia polymorpha]
MEWPGQTVQCVWGEATFRHSNQVWAEGANSWEPKPQLFSGTAPLSHRAGSPAVPRFVPYEIVVMRLLSRTHSFHPLVLSWPVEEVGTRERDC